MIGIHVLGTGLERNWGSLRIGVVYLLSGVVGVLVSLLFLPDVLTVGASGSVFGLIGACWADVLSSCLSSGQVCRAICQLTPLLVFTCLNLLIGFSPWVDNFVHLGGFVSGFVSALALFAPEQQGLLHVSIRLFAATSVLAFFVVAQSAAHSSLMRTALRAQCGGFCDYLNCIEPTWSAAHDGANVPPAPLWDCCVATTQVQCSILSSNVWVNTTCTTERSIISHGCDPRAAPTCIASHIDRLCNRYCVCPLGVYRVHLRGWLDWHLGYHQY